jgi:L-Lysine epsilon oxidase N-terminal/L-lysine epsilon oxidase C-terminal domain
MVRAVKKPSATAKSKKTSSTSRTKKVAVAAPRSTSLNVRLGTRTEYRIYPSIGIARVGDSAEGYFIGPSAPGRAPSGPFRGEKHKGIKPQAARFRIYKVAIDDAENEQVVEEIVSGPDVKIEWTVTLANRKAAGFQIYNKDGGTLGQTKNPVPRNDGLDRKKLVISASDAIPAIGGSSPVVLAGEIEFAKPKSMGPKVHNIVLATLRTDDAGRLLVVGGPGKSGSPTNATIHVFSDNDGWYDSVSDGPVTATLSINGQDLDVAPAWVLVTVPRYAPDVYGIVTWYDCAVNMARTNVDGTFNPPRTTSFTRDVYPILKRADGLSAVHAGTHSTAAAPALSDAAAIASYATTEARATVAEILTDVSAEASSFEQVPSRTMPKLNSGANPDPLGPKAPTWTFLALTRYQMAHIRNWAKGNFDADWPGAEPPTPAFEDIPVARQAWALTEAALKACVGGSFFPGIEGTYDIARIATYHAESNLRQEFRLNPAHPPGFLTEKMALPWQADFADCGRYWWPSQRPVNVTTEAGARADWDRGVYAINNQARHLNMVANWTKLGFVVRDQATGKFVEQERTLGEPLVG